MTVDARHNEALVAQLVLQREVEALLTHEAELLDERRYDEWLELFAEDVRYWMPMARNVAFDNGDSEYTRERAEANWFDEGKAELRNRVLQLQGGDHWAEEPRSRTTHVVANIRIAEVRDRELTVHSRFVVCQNRLEQEDLFVGKRIDVLRRGATLQVAHRTIYLDQSVLLSKSLTTFF
jgi:3-phenylpropionate/cinnamic acid dioxygenase small subunit